MELFTEDLIREAVNLNGSFYLAYRPHYNGELLMKAYPQIGGWMKKKEEMDSTYVLSSGFYDYLKTVLSK